MRVLMTVCLLILLSACSSKPPIIKTEVIEVPSPPELIPVPDDLTITEPVSSPHVGITWRELIELLLQDRAALERANGKLEAIRGLDSGER